jgi:hypothetical protein
MAKNLVMQGSETAMMFSQSSAQPKPGVAPAIPPLRELQGQTRPARHDGFRASMRGGKTVEASHETHGHRRYLARGVLGLCVAGLLSVIGVHWLSPTAGPVPVESGDTPPVELRLLQTLITGNLAVFLSWVWFDLRASARNEEDGAARLVLGHVAMAVAAVCTVTGVTWAGLLIHELLFPLALAVAAPTLAIIVSLLWFTARGVQSPGLRALLLAGVVMASNLVHQGPSGGEEPGIHIFTANSYLIGLAVALWLATWAAPRPCPRTT